MNIGVLFCGTGWGRSINFVWYAELDRCTGCDCKYCQEHFLKLIAGLL